MCGIVGIVSDQDVTQQTITRLASLEYRGYDSFGIAILDGSEIATRKDVGSVGKARNGGYFDDLPSSSLTLAHTRWATHGGVTVPNAHPHRSFDGRVAVVHNGVIENHALVRRDLESRGVEFRSETDTEVLAHLIALELGEGLSPRDAVAAAMTRVSGEFALGVLCSDEPDTLYGAKRKSPLVVGWDGATSVLASDQMALGDLSGEAIFLEDDDLVVLHRGTATVYAVDGGVARAAERPTVSIADQARVADKGSFPHWMIKEIHETPDAVRAGSHVPAAELQAVLDDAGDRLIRLVGAGSAFYVSQIGQYLLSALAGRSATALPSDEAAYLTRFSEGDPVIAVSQSGETFDTLEICRAAVAENATLTSISNVPNSTQERLATHRLRQQSGPEICVLSTKSIVGQVTLLIRLALETGRANGHLDDERYREVVDALTALPEILEKFVANRSDDVRDLAIKYSQVEDWFFIGRASLYPVACESALKFKEVSYRHAEGMAAGFFKHGTISLIDADFYTVALLPSRRSQPDRYAATMAAVSEIAARGGPVIGLGPEDAPEEDLRLFVDYLALPYQDVEACDIVVQLVAGQLLAYHCAHDLGREIDQPRSLAKSVTVR